MSDTDDKEALRKMQAELMQMYDDFFNSEALVVALKSMAAKWYAENLDRQLSAFLGKEETAVSEGGHRFKKGVCRCGQKITDEPKRCTEKNFQPRPTRPPQTTSICPTKEAK